MGDPHLKITKFDLAIRFLKEVEEVEKRENPDLTVFLGDLFDSHAVVRSEIMGEFRSYLLRHKRPRVYVLGNHDQFTPRDSKYHALQTFSNLYDGFHVVDKTQDLYGMTFVPYIHLFSEFPKETLPICIAHQTFIGADYGYTNADAGVDAEAVSADVIVGGHVHKRQSFGKVIYPGSAFAQGINDIDQDKGLMMFDTDTYQYRFIETSLPQWYGMKLELGPDYGIEDFHNDLFHYVSEGDNWVVDITGPRVEINAYLASKDFTWLKKDCKINSNLRIRPIYTDTQHKQVKIRSVAPETIITDYVEQVYGGVLDKSDVAAKALELFKEVDKVKN